MPFNRYLASRVVARACGLVLLAAVALKVGGQSGGVGGTLPMLSARVQLVGLELEALVGVWLVSGFVPRGAALAGGGLFAALGVVSPYLGLIGQASCGCFGRVSVSPWLTLALDVACAAALLVTRPAADPTRTASRNGAVPMSAALVAGLLVALLTSSETAKAFARLRGEAVVLSAGDADAGSVPQGEMRVVAVMVENLTGDPVRLIGGTTSCACVATADLPVTLPPDGRTEVRVGVRFTGEPGAFLHTFEWYTDAPTQPRVGGRIAGRVEPGVRAERLAS